MHIRGPSFYNLQAIEPDDARTASSPTRSRSSRASTRSWARSTGERCRSPRPNRVQATRDRRAVPAPKSAILPLAAPRAGPGRLGHARGDARRSRSSRRRRRPRCSGRAPSTRCSSARPCGELRRVGVHERHVPRHRRARAARARSSEQYATDDDVDGRRGRVPRRVRRRAGRCRSTTSSTATLTPRVGDRDRRGVPARARARRAACPAGSAPDGSRPRPASSRKRLHERPDDSWTIDARTSRPAATSCCARR